MKLDEVARLRDQLRDRIEAATAEDRMPSRVELQEQYDLRRRINELELQTLLGPNDVEPLMRHSEQAREQLGRLVQTLADRDARALAEGVAELKALMTIAEAQLARHGWLAGPEMSLADIAFGTQLYRYFELAFDRADLPNLSSYYARLRARPAYAAHAMVSFEALRVAGA